MLSNSYNNTTFCKKSQAENWFKKNWDKDKKDFLSGLDYIIIQDLKKSGLSLETVVSAGLTKFEGNSDDLKMLLGFCTIDKQSILQACSLLKIPYFRKGETTDYCRVRLYPALNDIKYLSPKFSVPIPYILPAVFSIKDKKNKEIWVTEGEKKALRLIQDGEYCIGLSGVWNFRAGKDTDDTPQNKELWDDIRDFVTNGRTFYIAYDADFIKNPDVRKALFSLSITLQNMGVIVKIATWDYSKGKGIDDYLVDGGDLVEIKQNALLLLSFIEKNKEYINDVLTSIKTIKLNDILKQQLQQTAKKCGILKKIFDSYLYRPELPKVTDMVTDDYTIPAPYRCIENMLCIVHNKVLKDGNIEETYEEICPFFYIINTIKATDSVELTLKFNDKTVVTDASGLGDTKKLSEQLNNSHVFITGRDAKDVADYIVNFLRVNKDIPQISYVSETGWNDDNSLFYAPTTYSPETVKYSDALQNEIAIKGSKDKQVELLREIFSNHTGAAITCLAGLSAPIFKLLGIDNIVFYSYGQSGVGKTLSDLIMMSLFGNPFLLKKMLNTTSNGAEIAISNYKDMPVLMDETATAAKKKEEINNIIINLIYSFSGGVGKTRAQRNLTLRKMFRFRGSLFLSSEFSLTSMLSSSSSEKANLGAYRRVIEIPADLIRPFAENVNFGDIITNITNNNGHILPVWIDYIKNNLSEIKERYSKFKTEYKIINLGGKQDVILLIVFVYDIFCKLFNIPYNQDIIKGIKDLLEYNRQVYFDEVSDPKTESERYLNAIREFALRSGGFINKNNNDKDYRPPLKPIGQVESDGDNMLYFYPIVTFKELCSSYNFERERVLSSITANIVRKDKYDTYPKSINNHLVKCYCFRFESEPPF
jgi:hypothetical protein